jgi:ribosome-binding ATPase YchF (GTP1/OBG family)
LEIVTGRIQRLHETLKKPRPNRDQQQAELEMIEPLVSVLEQGQTLHEYAMTEEQAAATRSFRLLTERPRLALVNLPDDRSPQTEQYQRLSTEKVPVVAVPVGLELELSRMDADEADEFRREMGIAGYDRDGLIRKLMETSGQMLFFTAGEKEVRTRMIPRGATALDAAGTIHTDLARGFIRAEVMRCEDLIRLGSEREVKQQHLLRQEHKDYAVQDGEILNIRFNV